MEALLLGLSSGLACVASCGPVLLPWLVVEGRPLRGTASLLAVFLAGRLVGYVAFSVVAWMIGLALAVRGAPRSLAFGLSYLGLSVVLLANAAHTPEAKACEGPCPRVKEIERERSLRRTFRSLTPAVLGLLTGLAVCPPFVAATLRAAERQSLFGAMSFFLLFFCGTSVWFFPFVAVGKLRPGETLLGIARIATAIVGIWYGYLGATSVAGRLWHGWT